MLDRISQDIKEAMKARDADRLNVLRMIKSRLIENKTATKPRAELDVIIQYHKQLKDSLGEYPKGSPQQQSIEAELKVISPYLPQPLSEDEVKNMIDKIMTTNDQGNFGVIMKELAPQIKGRFDGKIASNLIRERLG